MLSLLTSISSIKTPSFILFLLDKYQLVIAINKATNRPMHVIDDISRILLFTLVVGLLLASEATLLQLLNNILLSRSNY